MAKEQAEASEGKKKTGAKTGNRTIITIVLVALAVIALIGGLVWFFLLSGGESVYEEQEITDTLDVGECNEDQAMFLEREAAKIESLEERGKKFELAMNCYVQIQDWESAKRTAELAEAAYDEDGLLLQAEQMRAAADAHQLLIDFENGELDNGSSDGQEGDAV